MLRLLLATALIFFSACALGDDPHSPSNPLNNIGRPLIKEPRYRSTPKYSLIVLGEKADVKVWMVEDGKTLYVDRNANGDLTDDGLPIEPSDVRNLSKRHFGSRVAPA